MSDRRPRRIAPVDTLGEWALRPHQLGKDTRTARQMLVQLKGNTLLLGISRINKELALEWQHLSGGGCPSVTRAWRDPYPSRNTAPGGLESIATKSNGKITTEERWGIFPWRPGPQSCLYLGVSGLRSLWGWFLTAATSIPRPPSSLRHSDSWVS